jgi:HD-like signal output (HDOD) protein
MTTRPALSPPSRGKREAESLNLGALPALPAVAARALQVSGDPNSTAADLERIIACDPALAAKILRTANSAYYGIKYRVNTVRQGVVLLGLATVRSVVVSAGSYELFARCGRSSDVESLWLHSVATAVAAGKIAQKTRLLVPDEAYIAGLLHDIGIAVISISFPSRIDAIHQASSTGGVARSVAEQQVLGYDHSYAGGVAAGNWGLPSAVVSVIANHHTPNRATEAREAVGCVHLADLAASRAGIAVDPKAAGMESDGSAVAQLGLSPEGIDAISGELASSVGDICELAVGMAGGGGPGGSSSDTRAA